MSEFEQLRDWLRGQGILLQMTDGARDALATAGPRERGEVSNRLNRMLRSGELGAGDTATVGAGTSRLLIGVQHAPPLFREVPRARTSADGPHPESRYAGSLGARLASTATQIHPAASTSQKFTSR